MGFGKKGELGQILEPLIRIVVWILPFFFIMLFYTSSYAQDKYAVRETYAVDAGLVIEAIQAANGNLVYNYELPYDAHLKENTLYFPVNIEQKIKSEFAKDSAHTFINSEVKSGNITFLANGNQISILQADNTKKIEKKKTLLSCKKRAAPLANYILAINPAHGGVETGLTFESIEEGKMTFYIANAYKTIYSKDTSIILTRDADNSHATIEERLDKAKDSDLLVSIHIGSETNKGKTTIYIPDDSRKEESEILGCTIANAFFNSYDITYPYTTIPAGFNEILKAGKTAAVQIEVGSIEEKQSMQKIAETIKKGVETYAKPE